MINRLHLPLTVDRGTHINDCSVVWRCCGEHHRTQSSKTPLAVSRIVVVVDARGVMYIVPPRHTSCCGMIRLRNRIELILYDGAHSHIIILLGSLPAAAPEVGTSEVRSPRADRLRSLISVIGAD